MHKHYVRRAAKFSCALALILCVNPHASRADSFQSATYDPATDELVIVVEYRGTGTDHQFSLEWERCMDRGDNRHTIVAQLLDKQFLDAAREDYTKTLRMSLADMNCRPATVTLSTAPGFHMTVEVPSRAASASKP
jgi:hypothetical protein